jgi:hypothetical protein
MSSPSAMEKGIGINKIVPTGIKNKLKVTIFEDF